MATENTIWTPPKLVNWIANDFKKRGLPEPHRLEAEYLVSHALNISRLDIYLNHDKPCSVEEREQVKILLKRRLQREPLAYIIGSCEFWTLRLKVAPGVLIPRQDTETLIESTLRYLPERDDEQEPLKILELGTGSAAIPLALAAERKNLHIVTVEKSREALECAVENIEKYEQKNRERNNHIFPIHGDGFSALKREKEYDLIISNPPYIVSDVIQSLQKEVMDWEPSLALDGGGDGLSFYRYLRDTSPFLLRENGHLIFEHGYDQFETIHGLLSEATHLNFLERVKDYQKMDRVMVYQRK